jgi:hypothetical protein
MKKFFIAAGVLLLAAHAAFAQSGTAAGPSRLAVVEFSTNAKTEKTQQDLVTVRNLVESQMVATGKYQVISRAEIDKLLENQKIQVSAISSNENIKKLQLQNINYIVTGSVDAMDNDYAVTVKILDVATGKFSHSANDFMGSGSRDLYNGINTLVGKFTAGVDSSGGQVVQKEQGSSGGTYKIGDKGPGGGFIFYAEGGMYMECSMMLGEYTWTDAINAAKNYKGGGFTDWRLPSKGELDMIYKNLRKKNLAGLGDDWYWSSSQGNNNDAWVERFSDGNQGNDGKYGTGSVRAVRAF